MTSDALKCDLAGEALRSFGTLRLRVTGCSMLPSVWPGDILSIHRQDIGQISLGDIVLFAREGRLFAHRVVSTTGDFECARVITQGDALPVQDPPVTAAELLGRVCSILRAGKRIEPPARLSLRERLLAALVRHCTRAPGILVRWHSRRWNSAKQEGLCET